MFSGAVSVEQGPTNSCGNSSPTRKLAVQLEHPATAMAAGRGPWANNSATMNHGIGPGPISKLATNPNTAAMAKMLTTDVPCKSFEVIQKNG